MYRKKSQIMTLTITCLLVISLVSKTAFAETSVDMGEQLYRCTEANLPLEELSRVGVTILSHNTWTTDMEEVKQYLQKAHSLGIKILPYISVEKTWEVEGLLLERFNRTNPLAAIPYYKAVDPTYHWEWVLVNEDGCYMPRYGAIIQTEGGSCAVDWSRWFIYDQWYERNPPNSYTWYMCSSAPGYREAVARGVRAVMDMGFDGIFLDNTRTNRLPKCYGPEYGKHEHIDNENTDKSYRKMAQVVYKTVKSYGDDKILMLNGGTQGAYKDYRDACMLESYVIGGSNKRWDWEQITRYAEQLKNERKHNRVVCALSYVRGEMPPFPDRDNIFYAYSCAKLSGFLWSCIADEYQDIIRIFYRAGLKNPIGQMQQQKDIYFRCYDNGIVLVNPGEQSCRFQLPLCETVKKPVDLYSLCRTMVEEGNFVVDIPAQSGRVVCDLGDTIDYIMDECIVEIKRSIQCLTDISDETKAPAGRKELLEQGNQLVERLEEALSEYRTKSLQDKLKIQLINLMEEVQIWCSSLKSIPNEQIQRNCHAIEYAGAVRGLLADIQ